MGLFKVPQFEKPGFQKEIFEMAIQLPLGSVSCFHILMVEFSVRTVLIFAIALAQTRKYPLRGYILGSGAPGTPGVNP